MQWVLMAIMQTIYSLMMIARLQANELTVHYKERGYPLPSNWVLVNVYYRDKIVTLI